MGQRGPAKKPTALKKAQKQRPRDMPKDELMPPTVQKPKETFQLTDRGFEIYTDVNKRLIKIGLHTIMDTQTIIRYCDIFDQWLRYRDELQSRDAVLVVVSEDGIFEKPNPALKPYLALHKELLAIEKQFGMTPAARAAIPGVAKKDKKNDQKAKMKKSLYG